MDRKLTRTLITAAVVLPLGLLLFRFLQLLPYPEGDYNWVDSPDLRHRAYVYVLTDKGFFGGLEHFYTFTVEMGLPNGKRMKIFDEAIPPEDITADIDLLALEHSVKWAVNSGEVTFSTGRRDVKVIVPF